MSASPPLLAERALVAAIGDAEWANAIAGDLREEFVQMTKRHGAPYARRWYWAQAMGVAAHQLAARVRRPRRASAMLEPDPPDARAGLLSQAAHDLRAAWRSIRHQPALSATVVVVLALGLAANATTFALADAIVLRPFRYPGVERAAVVASDSHERFFDRESVAPADFLDWRTQAGDVFERMAAIEWWDPQYLPDGPPQQLNGFFVSPELFDILGEPALVGRPLVAADATANVPTAVISRDFWQRQFASRADIVGTQLRLDGVAYQIVGVMPGAFRAPYGADVWAPLRFTAETRVERARGWLMVVARLRPGVTPPQAEQRMQAVVAAQRRAFPDTHSKREVSVYGFIDGFGDAGAGPFAGVFQVAAFVLLLVACANVANLLLARNTEREREFAVRLALGASGRRLTWQLLLEGALLAGLASLLAIPAAWAAVGATRGSFPDSVIRFVPGWAFLTIEPRTLAATSALAGAAVLLFAVAPALRASRQNVTAGLRIGGRLTDGAARQRGRAVLACAQLALTLALLVAAGLSIMALYRVTEGPLGFDSTNVLVGRVTLPDARYQDPERRRQVVAGVLRRLDGLPSVSVSSALNVLPYSGADWSTKFWKEGVPTTEREALQVATRSATPSMFAALRIPLRSGRLFNATDRVGAPEVALVSESMAARHWPGDSALGKRFRTRVDGPLITVVGVVGDVVQHWLVESLRPSIYRPLEQAPPSSLYFVVRTVADPVQLSAALRAAVQAEDRELPVVGVRTMEGVIEDSTVGLRFAGRTLGAMALGSGLLSAVGIYSLMAFLTGRRTREMGLRMALGATRSDVIRLACRQGLRLTAGGVAVGLILAFLVGRGLESALFGLVHGNAGLTIGLAVVLSVTAFAASYLPARRVSRVEPTIALRAE
jgi:putative ABC transport system permease protein